jgi:hypothetical protein
VFLAKAKIENVAKKNAGDSGIFIIFQQGMQ